MKFFSPAKINLFLRVLYRRADHFHEIFSLMQAISLGDVLTFEESDREMLTHSHPGLPHGDANYIIRALRLFQKKTGYLRPISIHVDKNTPIEGGLGGGSSNVATTLWALNKLSNFAVKEERLKEWAGTISSDAPFFFSSGTAFSMGRGEKIMSLPPPRPRVVWLARPEGKGLPTAMVYQHCHYNTTTYSTSKREPLLNDLEPAAFELRPDLSRLKKELKELGFEAVTMTGSGTTFFCFGDIHPNLPGIKFSKVNFLSRSCDWYRLK